MSDTAKAPMLRFGTDGFKPASERIKGERERRIAEGADRLRWGISFLDDITRGIRRKDLIILGAVTGAGKTELVTGVAQRAAKAGKRIHFFALEAEPDEIERRMKFRIICEIAAKSGLLSWRRWDYLDWLNGDLDTETAPYEDRADAVLAGFRNLTTYYRGRDFDVEDIERLFRAIQDQSDLIVLDHIHYVDYDDSSSENAAIRSIVVRIRDVALDIGIPVVAIAHLRKRQGGKLSLVPSLDEFHGSSEITKRATLVVVLAPAIDDPSPDPTRANTYIFVAKHRMRGATGLVAKIEFDRPSRLYANAYELGRISLRGDEFLPIDPTHIPRWARSAAGRSMRGEHDR